jgi:Spy/CpxP family protein refolding chaperone
VKLRPDQKQHMDAIFETSRPALQKSFQDYQQEQGKLEAMYRSKSLDENTLYAQIDRVSQTRAELGKVYTHYLLQIRAEMDTDQLQRLDDATKKQ